MATSNEKFQLVFEARETASAKIRTLNTQLTALGGPKMVKSQQQIKKLERQVKMLSGTAKKGSMVFSRFTQGIAIGNIAAVAITSVFRKLKDVLVGTIAAAANTERQWGMVTAALERHELATTKNIVAIRTFADDMQTLTGIADEDFGRAIQSMVDRGASLSQAFKMIAATADLAASKNKDMKRVLNEMVDAIGRKNLLALDKYGVKVDASASFTDQLNTAIEQLNKNFGGAASDVADTYAVRMAVLGQKFGDLQEKIGGQALPTLIEFVNTLAAFVDEFSNIVFASQFNKQGELVVESGGTIIETLQGMRNSATGWMNILVGTSRIVGNAFQIVMGAIKVAFSPVVDQFIAFTQLIRGDFSGAWDTFSGILDNVYDESTDVNANIQELLESFDQLKVGMDVASVVGGTAMSTVKDSTTAAADAIRNMTIEIPQMVEDTSAFIEEEVKMATKGMTDTTRNAALLTANAGNRMKSMMGSAINGMIDNMVTGRQSFSEIFKGIAQDFMIYFIKQALFAVINKFIPGLGSLLGSIFDTPANDRMAAQQGQDFMEWFTRGALAEAQGGSEMAVGISRPSNSIAPVASSGGGSAGGAVVIHVNVSGNVLTDEFVEKTIAPKLRSLVNDGRSLLSVQDENVTGGRDVDIN